MDLGWIASAAPIVLGAGVGLVARRVIAANDQRRASAATAQARPAGAPKALRPAVPIGNR
jgi:hypothetical protein